MAVDRLRQAALLAALCGAVALAGPAPGQETSQPERRATAPEPPAPPDIVVRGRGYGELRLNVRLAEEAVFARWNDINSTDDFDIHCEMQPIAGSHIHERVCLSNSWREHDANIGQATVRMMRREMVIPPSQFRAEQLMMQRRLGEEMRRLVVWDDELQQAISRLGQAKLALAERTGGQPDWTLWRQVRADDGLPYEAERMFEVRTGHDPWVHALERRTFTIGHVTGKIHALDLDCENQTLPLDYEEGVDWTVPEQLGRCVLIVRARKDTTFALFEF